MFPVADGSQCWGHVASLTALPGGWDKPPRLPDGHPVDCNILLLPNNGTV